MKQRGFRAAVAREKAKLRTKRTALEVRRVANRELMAERAAERSKLGEERAQERAERKAEGKREVLALAERQQALNLAAKKQVKQRRRRVSKPRGYTGFQR